MHDRYPHYQQVILQPRRGKIATFTQLAHSRDVNAKMTNWKPIANAPKTGTRVLLWAQCKGIRRDGDYNPIVGYWDRSIERWKVAPEHLNREEELVLTHRLEFTRPPKS